MSKIIGIDLGTTNSVVAVMEGGQPVVIPNQEGGRTTPSVVGFTKSGERLVGQVAKRQAVTNPENTIYSIKRFMGRRHDEVSEEMKLVPYHISRGPSNDARVDINGSTFPARDLGHDPWQIEGSGRSLPRRKGHQGRDHRPSLFQRRAAASHQGRRPDRGPRSDAHHQRADRGRAGYGLDKKKDETIAVYDFGGGTFDISILEVGDGVVEVKSTNGDTHLGGDNIDQRIIDWIITEFKNENGIDLSRDQMALQRLKEAAEKAKIELSTLLETEINLPFITADASGPKHLVMKLTRARYEQMVEDILMRCAEPCKKALADAGLTPSQIDEVVLVGGSTRIPRVQQIVRDLFGKEPNKSVNPDEVVAVGAAVQGGVLGGEVKDVLLLDVTPLSLGMRLWAASSRSSSNATPPSRPKSEVFSTASDSQTSVEIKVYQGERSMAADNRLLVCSNWSVSRRLPVACRRSKSRSTSTLTAS
jgi:molecular chaperone DnaK